MRRPKIKLTLAPQNLIQRQLKSWFNSHKTPHNGVVKSVEELIEEYLYSDAYKGLSVKSKGLYYGAFKKFQAITLERGESFYKIQAYKVNFILVDHIARILGTELAQSSIQVYFAAMSTVWNYALRAGRVNSNPWLKPGLGRAQERDVTWTKEQVDKAIEVAHNRGYTLLALYILLAYETAQRPWQDLRNLTWNNIKQLEDGSFVIDFSISKTHTHLIIPLSTRAISAIQTQPKASSFILVNPKGEHVNQGVIKLQFSKIKEEAGLPKDLQIRDLRRTAITELAMAGCSTLEIEAITGWRCPESVIRRYARVRLETAKNALQKRQQLQGN